MGLIRGIKRRTASIETLMVELKEVGLSTEEIEAYEKLSKKYNDIAEKTASIDKSLEKAERKRERLENNIEHTERKIEKKKEKIGILSRIFFWSKKAREYRKLKQRLKREKSRLKTTEHTIKMLNAEAKSKFKDAKHKAKQMKKMAKMIKKEWSKAKYPIKFIKEYQRNKKQLKEMYNEKSIEFIEEKIKELQEKGEIEGNYDAKQIYKLIKTQSKQYERNGIKKKISIVKEIKEQQDNQQQRRNIREDTRDWPASAFINHGIDRNKLQSILEENVNGKIKDPIDYARMLGKKCMEQAQASDEELINKGLEILEAATKGIEPKNKKEKQAYEQAHALLLGKMDITLGNNSSENRDIQDKQQFVATR